MFNLYEIIAYKLNALCLPDSESGPNNTMIMESAGVSAAMMALKAIGKSHYLSRK
jgi:hypothetical protein